MKHLTIIVPEGQNNLSSIVGTYKIISRANAYWKSHFRKDMFKIQLAGLSTEVDFHGGLFSVKPHTHVSEISKTDLIIIPSLNHNYYQSVRQNAELITWIETQYKRGAEVASICTGAFLLAASGLLNGRKCSTHWSAANDFRAMFPEVELQPDRLITDEQGIYTNGGAYSFLNLIVYLIEKYFDHDTAVYCSKVFEIDPERNAQSSFIIFSGQKHHDDEAIRAAQEYMEEHADSKIAIEDLSARFSIDRRNFDRRFKKATGNSPLEYLQRVKIEAAKKSLESTRKTVNEVMYDVGYNDVKAFRGVFRKIAGMSPLEYRQRYNRDVV